MKAFKAFKTFLKRLFYYPEWRCVVCGKEIFDGGYFCEKCRDSLPFIDGATCSHCGRKVVADEEYCSTCKGKLTATDRARSVFNYEKPVSTLIKRAKYDNAKYLLDAFSDYLAAAYFKNYYNSYCVTFVPATDKAKKKRGYNQSEILAAKVSEKTGVPLVRAAVKTRETPRQASLNADKRRKNLAEAFRITDKSAVAGKNVLIIDDVTTTGSTGEALAEKLKKAGAAKVELLTVASVPPKDGY